jgi:hypothetical protein
LGTFVVLIPPNVLAPLVAAPLVELVGVETAELRTDAAAPNGVAAASPPAPPPANMLAIPTALLSQR